MREGQEPFKILLQILIECHLCRIGCFSRLSINGSLTEDYEILNMVLTSRWRCRICENFKFPKIQQRFIFKLKFQASRIGFIQYLLGHQKQSTKSNLFLKRIFTYYFILKTEKLSRPMLQANIEEKLRGNSLLRNGRGVVLVGVSDHPSSISKQAIPPQFFFYIRLQHRHPAIHVRQQKININKSNLKKEITKRQNLPIQTSKRC